MGSRAYHMRPHLGATNLNTFQAAELQAGLGHFHQAAAPLLVAIQPGKDRRGLKGPGVAGGLGAGPDAILRKELLEGAQHTQRGPQLVHCLLRLHLHKFGSCMRRERSRMLAVCSPA